VTGPHQTEGPRVRRATPEDADALVATLVQAFDDDPVMNWLLRQGDKRADAHDLWFRTCLDVLCMPAGHTHLTDDGAAAAMWVPPGGWSTNPLGKLGLVPALLRATGLGRLHRLAALSRATDRVKPKKAFFYLLHLGVVPERQGEGLGSVVMRPVLELCDREGAGAYLESSKETNIPFYERHGFEVTSTISPGRGAPRLWGMWREAG